MQVLRIKYKTKPNKDELAIFYYNRYVEAGKKTTLPHLTEQWINDFLAAYEPVFENKSIA
jgi:DNA-binding transcriptional regulator YbjK